MALVKSPERLQLYPSALATREGNCLPKILSNHLLVAIACVRSTPCSMPDRSSRLIKSSVEILPVALGANGQPPSPPILASSVVTPDHTAAQALAMPVLRVSWKCARILMWLGSSSFN